MFCTAPGFVYSCHHPPGPPVDSCLTLSFGRDPADDLFRPAAWPALNGRPILPVSNRRGYAAARLLARLNVATLDIEAAALDMLAATVDAERRPGRLYRPSQLAWYARRIDRARETLDVEFAVDHSLRSLATDAGMSPFHFARVFTELAGCPPHRYLVRRRLDHAARALRQGASVTDACFGSGFSSLSHFVRRFRQRHGLPPSAWKKRRPSS